MSSQRSGVKVLKKPNSNKITRKKQDPVSKSRILQKIIYCLVKKLHTHMLYWDNEKNKEFIIKFVHKNNPKWKSAYLDLFKELDKLSSNYEKYLKAENYDERCKGRCKSNLQKLCGKNGDGALTFIKEINVEKSIRLMKYKLNVEDISNVKNPVPRGGEMTKKNNVKKLKVCEAVQGDKGCNEDKPKIETLPNKQPHYLCLSKINQVAYIVVPVEASISNHVASPNNSAEGLISGFQSNGKIASPDWNNTVERMGTQELSNMQYTGSGSNGVQNRFLHIASPNNSADGLNDGFQSNGKIAFSDCTNTVERMGTQKLSNMQYTGSGSNGVQNSFLHIASPNNSADGLNAGFQSNGKIAFPDCTNTVERMGTQELSNMQYTGSGSNGVQNSFLHIASPNNSADGLNAGFQSNGKIAFSDCTNTVERMGTQKLSNMQYTGSGSNGVQNSFLHIASPNNSADGLNAGFQSNGKIAFPDCTNTVERMGTQELSNMQYTGSGSNGVQNSFLHIASPNNSADGLNAGFQSNGKIAFSDCTNTVERMGTQKLSNMQYTGSGSNGVQNSFLHIASPNNSADGLNAGFQSNGKIAFSDCTNTVERMGTQKLSNMQYTGSGSNGVQNSFLHIASPNNSADGLNAGFQSNGKIAFPDCTNTVERMGTQELSNMQYTGSGSNGVQNSFLHIASPNNSADGLNAGFQSNGKIAFSDCTNTVERMGTQKLSNMQYTGSGSNGVQNSFLHIASPNNSADGLNAGFQSNGKIAFSDCTNTVERMGTQKLSNMQYTGSGSNGVQNSFLHIASPNNSADSLNAGFQSNGKIAFSDYTNTVERMGTQELSNMQYTGSGSNGVQNRFLHVASPNNSADGLNSGFQTNGKIAFSDYTNTVERMGTQELSNMQYTGSGSNGVQNSFLHVDSPNNSAEGLISGFQSNGKIASPDWNNTVERMGTQELSNMQYTGSGSNGVQNRFLHVASPNNSADGLNAGFQSNGKITFLDCTNTVERMGTEELSSMQYTGSGYNGVQNSFLNEGLQDLNAKSKNCAQMVPGSPLEYNVLSNDPPSDWEMDDISKPLQGDCDPFLPPMISDPSSNNFCEGNSLLLDTEDWYSFANLVSIDAVS